MVSMSKIKRFAILNIAALVVFAAVSPASAVLALDDGTAITDGSSSVTSSEVTEALKDTAGVLSASDQVSASSDGDSAIKAATAGASIDIPKDASNGVSLTGTSGTGIEISLPNAEQASDASSVATGVVAYAGSDGSANAVQATENGGVRMLTIIDNPNAPTVYDYKVTIPNGGHIELIDEGGAVVVDSTGELIAAVDTPWAKDATGKTIETYFTTDGQTLTQHINHNVAGVVYPVTADPAWFAVAAGVVAWAVGACAASVASGIGLDGIRWAIQRGDWYWNKKLEDALWNCAWGAATGGIMRFAPGSVKSWLATQIKDGARNILRWRI